ncbi:MAG: type II secretion system protein GspL [Gammaproteobacteria bacterium]|nr:type II secretion system protein GspL [Gammaproteobacteria bacterium]
MEETIIIYIQTNLLDVLDDGESHFVKWIKLDSEGNPITRGAEARLEQVSSVAQNAHVIVLLPLQQMLLSIVNTRARKSKHLQKAIPFALEDEVADDIENLHFALGRRYGENDYPVAVIEKVTLDSVLETLASAGVYPDILTADVFALPFKEGSWTILVEADRALVRTSKFQGFTIDLHNLQQMLTSSLRQAEITPSELNIYRCDSPQSGVKSFTFPINTNELDDCPPGLFADGLDENECINLLQGSYQKKDKKHRQFAPWKIAAILFGVWVGLSMVSVLIDHARFSKEEKRLDAQIEQELRQTFPDIQNVTAGNARIKMEARLRNFIADTTSNSYAGFMELLALSGESMQQAGNITINTMNYRDGKLNVNVNSPDVQALDKVKQLLKTKNFFADIQSANTQGAIIEAQLVISKGEGK